jgi:hypothetical protein
VIDQQCGAPVQLIGNIEQMCGEAVRRHARKQRPADPKLCRRTFTFGD